MKTIVSVVGYKTLGCSKEQALAFIQELNRISEYEPKINEAQISRVDQTHGEYTTVGIFSCIPWRGRFLYSLNDHGFHSHMVGGLLANNMQGGFVVFPIDDQTCQLWHYEEYRFPRATIVLRPGLRSYLKKAMHQELLDIEAMISESLDHVGGLDDVGSHTMVATTSNALITDIKSEIQLSDLFLQDIQEGSTDTRMNVPLEFSRQDVRRAFSCCK